VHAVDHKDRQSAYVHVRGDVAIVLQKPAHVKSRRILAQSLGRGCKTPYERAAADRQRRVQGLGGECAGNREGDAEEIVVACQCPKRADIRSGRSTLVELGSTSSGTARRRAGREEAY
jgi:hypothetical protein